MTTPSVASAPATRFWAERGPFNWARVLPTYWEAGSQPHRAELVQALKGLPTFESVRELGCCAGTNLRMIREAFPKVLAQGMDVSEEAVLFAQDKFVKDGAVGIVQADILADSRYWEPGEVDVVFSCYTLAYIAPADLRLLLRAMVRSAKVGVVVVEPMLGDFGLLRSSSGLIEWRHDYTNLIAGILEEDARPSKLESWPLPTPVELCDGLIRVTFLG